MQCGFRYLILKLQCLIAVEDGQDMAEYCLVAALISLACFASTNSFARLLIGAFTSVVNTFDGYV
jgi:Flp pilus assembly pilin Flp